MRLLIGVCKTAGGASVINMCSVVTRKVRRKEFEIKGEKTEGKKRRKKNVLGEQESTPESNR